ncbi:Transcription factor, partial [Spiromyces aspiralis]
ALKCRQRKKQRLMELQGRVEWLTDVNERLKTEAMRLREEALYIRSLLQAHQNCSITQVNQAAGLRPVPVLPPMQKLCWIQIYRQLRKRYHNRQLVIPGTLRTTTIITSISINSNSLRHSH